MEAINHNPDKNELRKFGFIFATGLVLIFGLLLPWIWDKPWPQWPFIAAAVFTVVGLLVPIALKPVYIVWMKIGQVLGWINTRIILGLIFFILFAPIALLFRIIGRDPMERKLDSSVATYRKPSHTLPRDRMEKPF